MTEPGNLVKQGDGTYVAFVQHAEACNLINKRLRYYQSMPDFVESKSEGRFIVTQPDLAYVIAIMKRFKCL